MAKVGMVLTCEQFGILSEIVKNGNGQGTMVCDGCGSWDYMGIPSEYFEDCPDIDGDLFRYITIEDLEAAEVVYHNDYEYDCNCQYCDQTNI